MPADIINPTEESHLRAEAQKWYNDVCTIKRETRAADAYGGETETPAIIASNVPCDISAQVQTMRPTEVIGGQIEMRQVYAVALAPGTDVDFQDRLLITSRTPQQEMVVQSVLKPETWDIELIVYASLEGEPLA